MHITISYIAVALISFFSVLNAESISGEITVSHPENIQFLLEKFKAGFEEANPKVRINLQGGPSAEQVRRISTGRESADVIVVSDDRLARAELKSAYLADPVEFMTDEIVLIAGKSAKYFDELQIRKWHEPLLRPDVKIGIPDPMLSYAGYRAPLVWKLAETWVHNLSLYENLTKKISTEEPVKSTISALQSGALDYSFDYDTQARQHGLRKFQLTKYYNLGDPSLAHVYKSSVIKIGEGETKLLHGEPIIYSIGCLKDSKNPAIAQAFVEFVSGPEGKAILKAEELTAIQ